MSKTLHNLINKAMMFVFNYFDCKDFSVSYKPSRDEFHCFVAFVGKKEPQEFII